MVKKIKTLSLLSLCAMPLLLTAFSSHGLREEIVTYGYTNNDAATYYSNITSDLADTALLNALQDLQSSKLKSRVGYNSMPSYFSKTDKGDSGKIMAFYNGGSYSYSSMNREHVWPASRTVLGRDKDPLEDDIHMVRPTLSSDNSDRGNAFFVEGKNYINQSWDPANCGNETYRGDSARIIFYCVVADPQLKLVAKDTDSSSNHSMGNLEDLLKWNLKYPVLEREKVRNEAAEQLQGNRNPFIDHPEYACRVWGKYNDNTKKICGFDQVTGISLNMPTRIVEVGKKIRFDVTVYPEGIDDDYTWSSSNPSVANVASDGLVSAYNVGVTNITVTTSDGAYSDTCVLTVTAGSGNANSSSGCGGNIVTTSVVLSTISMLGISILLIKKYSKKEL